MGRPAKFTHAQLQSVALRLVDSQGLAGLSMRSLAAALETGPMTLYNYVSQREELDVLVVDAVLAEVSWPAPDQGPWEDALRGIALALWKAVNAHPNAVPLLLTRRSRSPAMLTVAEALLTALARSGRQGMPLLVAFRAVTALIMGAAQADLAGPLNLQAGESAQDTIARFRALPVERFPHLIDIAGAASANSAQAEFQAGLDLLIDGLTKARPAGGEAPGGGIAAEPGSD